MSFKKLVYSSLYNWLGYGNLDGRIWFIGTEEGGAEIWRNKTKSLEESLSLRSQYKLSMDFRHVWEELYGIGIESFKGPCVWRFMAAFLLSLDGKEANKMNIEKYVFKRKLLGRNNSEHFMCELLPLPKKKKNSILPYDSIWTSISVYHKEVLSRRFEIIRDTIAQKKSIELIISYEKTLTDKVLDHFKAKQISNWMYKKEQYTLYEIEINEYRTVNFLSTPFFGNGQISYDGISKAVEKLLKKHTDTGLEYLDEKSEVIQSEIVNENKNMESDKRKDYYSEDDKVKIISRIGLILGNDFKPKYNKTGVTFYGDRGRILKVVKKQKYLEVEFNVPVQMVSGLIVLTEKERIENKMGTCRWIYKGDDISTVVKLVEEAVEKY